MTFLLQWLSSSDWPTSLDLSNELSCSKISSLGIQCTPDNSELKINLHLYTRKVGIEWHPIICISILMVEVLAAGLFSLSCMLCQFSHR